MLLFLRALRAHELVCLRAPVFACLRVYLVILFLRALRAHELVCLRAPVFACLRVYLVIFLLCFAYIVKLMFGN